MLVIVSRLGCMCVATNAGILLISTEEKIAGYKKNLQKHPIEITYVFMYLANFIGTLGLNV